MLGHFFKEFSILAEKLFEFFLACFVFHIHNSIGQIFKARTKRNAKRNDVPKVRHAIGGVSGHGGKMKRVLLDTNIYGLIVMDKDRPTILEKLSRSTELKIYGNYIIRKELRDTPKGIIDGINLRNDLIRLFDQIVDRHNYEITSEMQKVAENYFVVYRKLGGKTKKAEIINDFLIVACASVHNLDIVISEDRRSMCSDFAVNSYDIVNSISNRKSPNFVRYEKFKSMVNTK